MRRCGSSRPISDPRLTCIKAYYCNNLFLKKEGDMEVDSQ